jgi:hypothetical protein
MKQTSLILSNCRIRLGRKELFRHMTLRFVDWSTTIEFEGLRFCSNGHSAEINLLNYIKPGQLCYVTVCAEILISFDDLPGELEMQSENRVILDVTSSSCFSFWSHSQKDDRPLTCQITESTFLENLVRLQRNEPLIPCNIPSYYSEKMPGFYDSVQIYHVIRRCKVTIIEEDTPSISLDNVPLTILRKSNSNILIYNGSPIASLDYNREVNSLSFTIIHN